MLKMAREMIQSFKNSGRQTKYFILMCAIYSIAMIWSTVQSYVRLVYSRSDIKKPIVIEIPPHTP